MGSGIMKKVLNEFFDYAYLEFIAFILIIFWAIAPAIEYIFKNYIHAFSTMYFSFMIYFIGTIGILEYIIFLWKKHIDNAIEIKKCIPQILIGILLIISLISSIFSNNPNLSFFVEGYRKEGLIVYIMYIGFILSSSIIKDKKYINKIFKIIVLSALFITVMPYLSNNFSYRGFRNIYHQFNHYGYFLMISAILSGFIFLSNKRKIERIAYLIIYLFLLYQLIINNTFGCYLAMFISLLFTFVYALIKKQKRIECTVLIVIFIMSSYLIPHYNIKIGESKQTHNIDKLVVNNITSFESDIKEILNNGANTDKVGSGRGRLWKEAWNYTLEHPLIGGGMESLRPYYRSNNIKYNDRPHNIILQISSFIGIPGAIIYIILITYLAITNLKNLENDAINITIYITAMSYFISSLFGNSMYYTSPYFMILLGFLIRMNEKTS